MTVNIRKRVGKYLIKAFTINDTIFVFVEKGNRLYDAVEFHISEKEEFEKYLNEIEQEAGKENE